MCMACAWRVCKRLTVRPRSTDRWTVLLTDDRLPCSPEGLPLYGGCGLTRTRTRTLILTLTLTLTLTPTLTLTRWAAGAARRAHAQQLVRKVWSSYGPNPNVLKV